jgi:hypothetical protein
LFIFKSHWVIVGHFVSNDKILYENDQNNKKIYERLKLTPEEIKRILNTASWKEIGQGSYNTVYVSDIELTINGHTQKWVQKIAKELGQPVSHSDRAVRKWNKIHPRPEDKAYLVPQ